MKNQEKSEGVAIILAVLVGLLGFYGVGHMYVGRIRRGLVILFLDWVISISGFFSLMVGLSGDIELLVLGVVLLVGSLILWIWQIFDARRVCREHNQGL